ncbi:MAG: rhodanese-like domain-containing protein [Desulfobulbaceae bacterium]|nr:rhodanese-like domain-containing protein [Desulfobulbaceae bacterium]
MKRISGVIILGCLFFAAVVACSGEQTSSEKRPASVASQKVAPPSPRANPAKIFQSISSREARSLMATRKDLMLVDLREAKELREGYIAGSQLIPMSKIAKGTEILPDDRPLLLICAVGGRSYGVGRYFSGKGYPEIYNLKGGISAWKKAGLSLQY